MKHLISYTLIFLYLLSALQVFIPIAEYALEKERIAKELCEQKEVVNNDCQGMCYLTKKIEKHTTTEKAIMGSLKSQFPHTSLITLMAVPPHASKIHFPNMSENPNYYLCEVEIPPPKIIS